VRIHWWLKIIYVCVCVCVHTHTHTHIFSDLRHNRLHHDSYTSDRDKNGVPWDWSVQCACLRETVASGPFVFVFGTFAIWNTVSGCPIPCFHFTSFPAGCRCTCIRNIWLRTSANYDPVLLTKLRHKLGRVCICIAPTFSAYDLLFM
jgi:hypothetical protein